MPQHPPHPARSSPYSVFHAIAWLVLIGVAWWLRAPLLERGLTSDELVNVWPGSVVGLWLDAETGVNPPLWRLITNLGIDPSASPAWGRHLSLAANLACMPLLALVARQAGATPLAALWAAGWWAVHPAAIRVSAEHRAYSLLALLMLGFLATSLRAAREPSPRALIGMGVIALCLPWTHYITLPWLGLLFLWWVRRCETRLVATATLPALVGALPLVYRILTDTSRRVATPHGLADSMSHLISFGQFMPEPIRSTLIAAEVPGAAMFGLSSLVGGALILLALATVAYPREEPLPAQRILAPAITGLLLTIVVLSTRQHVRPPVACLVVALFAPLLAVCVSQAKMPWRAVSLAALTYWMVAGAIPANERWARHDPFSTVDAAAIDMTPWLQESSPFLQHVALYPSSLMPGLTFRWTGLRMSQLPTLPECAGHGACVAHEGMVYSAWTPQQTRTPWVVTLGRARAPASTCVRQHGDAAYALWRCPLPGEAAP